MKPTGQDLFQAFQRIRKSNINHIHKQKIQDLKPHEFFMLSTIKCLYAQAVQAALKKNEAIPPGIMISKISQDTSISMPGVSQTISSLVKHNMVVRISSEIDRRLVYVNLTKKGEALQSDYNHTFYQIYHQAAKSLGPDDTKELIRLLDKLTSIIEKIEDNQSHHLERKTNND